MQLPTDSSHTSEQNFPSEIAEAERRENPFRGSHVAPETET